MSRARFRRDPQFEQLFYRSAQVAAMLKGPVDEAARVATELAPDDPSTTGRDLHTSIYGDVAMTSRGYMGRVGALNFKAPWFEYGAEGVRRQPFLRPAAERVIGPIESGENR